MIFKTILYAYSSVLACVLLFFIIKMTLSGFRKSWAITRILVVITLIGPAQILSPLAIIGYFFDRVPILRWLTWFVMDDSRFDRQHPLGGYSNDYFIFLKDRGRLTENFRTALQWHLGRNRVYNLLNCFSVPFVPFEIYKGNNNIHSVEFTSDELYRKTDNVYQKWLHQDGPWVIMAGLKYVPIDPLDDPWQVNAGDAISKKTSVLGHGGMYYMIKRWTSYRYSSCNERKILWLFPRWLTIKFGTNSSRYIPLTVKIQRIKPWE